MNSHRFAGIALALLESMPSHERPAIRSLGCGGRYITKPYDRAMAKRVEKRRARTKAAKRQKARQ